jgi:hypothetical protein
MLGTAAPLFKLITAILAARGVPHKNCDDWGAGIDASLAQISSFFVGEGERVPVLHNSASPNPTERTVARS